MFDGLTIGGAISGLQTAAEVLKTLVGLSDARKIEAEIAKLTPIIIASQKDALAAYKEQLALLEEVGRLKARVMQLEGKSSELERYKRTDMGGGTFAYTLKDGVKPGEDNHAACAQCYEKGRISTLQRRGTNPFNQVMHRCESCKTMFAFGERQKPTIERGSSLTSARRGSRFGG